MFSSGKTMFSPAELHFLHAIGRLGAKTTLLHLLEQEIWVLAGRLSFLFEKKEGNGSPPGRPPEAQVCVD